MKVLIFSGNHSRHLFVHQGVLEHFEVCGVVCMERESVLPEPPENIGEADAQNFRRHFQERYEVEQRCFGQLEPHDTFAGIPTHYSTPETLNSEATRDFVLAQKPDLVFIFGVDIIKEPLVSVLPSDRVNMHLGLSPWYKGAATLFWPFYNLEPQFCGATFHQIVLKADAGGVIHQVRPMLEKGDGIHDVGAKTVIESKKALIKLLNLRTKQPFVEVPQTTTGRLYLGNQFHPEHLRVIYNLYNNDIVDAYLRKELSQHQPKIISAF